MDILKTPLEALIFKYLSFGFLTTINGLWTWVAVITAAISFWRIRAVCFHFRPHKSDGPPLFDEQITDESHATEDLRLCESSEKPTRKCSCTSSVPAVEDNGTVKGKFTLYYSDDADDNGESTLIEGWVNRGCSVREFGEEMMARRRTDLGWYRDQDLTVLNGSVVRLWDGVRRRSSKRDVGVRW